MQCWSNAKGCLVGNCKKTEKSIESVKTRVFCQPLVICYDLPNRRIDGNSNSQNINVKKNNNNNDNNNDDDNNNSDNNTNKDKTLADTFSASMYYSKLATTISSVNMEMSLDQALVIQAVIQVSQEPLCILLPLKPF